MKQHWTVAALAVLACLLWSTAFAGIKIGLLYTTPFMLAGTRFILSGLLLIPFCGSLKNYLRAVRKNISIVMLISLTQTFFMYGLFFMGVNMIPGAVAAIIIGSSPLITAIITHLTLGNDRFSIRKLITIIIGISGIVFVVTGRQIIEGVGLQDIVGVLLLVIVNILSSVSSVLVSAKTSRINPVILNSSQLFIGGILLVVLSLFTEGSPSIIFSWQFVASLFWLALISAAAFSIWYILLRKDQVMVSELEMWKFLIPVFGAVFSWILLPDESPTLISVIGMMIIAVSIIIYNLPGSKNETLK